jgi:hypothetical protein
LEEFCRDVEALKKFYDEITPIHPAASIGNPGKEREIDVNSSSGISSPREMSASRQGSRD